MGRILVIDDEAQLRQVLERMLKGAGHEVIVAGNGDEGLKEFQRTAPDLVITDIFMPERDGFETIIHLRKLNPKIPVIAISGKPAGRVMLSVAEKLGTTAVLEKPFTLEQLLAAVGKAL
jgi:CheY-like chemotaxis protein